MGMPVLVIAPAASLEVVTRLLNLLVCRLLSWHVNKSALHHLRHTIYNSKGKG